MKFDIVIVFDCVMHLIWRINTETTVAPATWLLELLPSIMTITSVLASIVDTYYTHIKHKECLEHK